MAIRKPTLNPYEERILRILSRGRRALTTSQVSQFSGISYNTTKDYLTLLNNKKKIRKRTESNKIYWWVEQSSNNSTKTKTNPTRTTFHNKHSHS